MIKNNYNDFNNKTDLDVKKCRILMGTISVHALLQVGFIKEMGEEWECSTKVDPLKLKAKFINEKPIQEIRHGP